MLGDDKFAKSLIKNIDLAENLASICANANTAKTNPANLPLLFLNYS